MKTSEVIKKRWTLRKGDLISEMRSLASALHSEANVMDGTDIQPAGHFASPARDLIRRFHELNAIADAYRDALHAEQMGGGNG